MKTSQPRPHRAPRTVALAMHPDPKTVRETSPLMEAVALMADGGFRHVPVVDENRRVVGILSDRDLRSALGDPLEALRSDREGLELLVADVMSVEVETVTANLPLVAAVELLTEDHFGALPVVDGEGRLAGILSYVDVLRELAHPRRREAASAPAACGAIVRSGLGSTTVEAAPATSNPTDPA